MDAPCTYELQRLATMAENARKLDEMFSVPPGAGVDSSFLPIGDDKAALVDAKRATRKAARRACPRARSFVRSTGHARSRDCVVDSDDDVTGNDRGQGGMRVSTHRVSLRVQVEKKVYYYPADSELPVSNESKEKHRVPQRAALSAARRKRVAVCVADEEKEDDAESDDGGLPMPKRSQVTNHDQGDDSDVDWMQEFDFSGSDSDYLNDPDMMLEEEGAADLMLALGSPLPSVAPPRAPAPSTTKACCISSTPFSPLHAARGDSKDLLTAPFVYKARMPSVPFLTSEMFASLPLLDDKVGGKIVKHLDAKGVVLDCTLFVCISPHSTQAFYPTAYPRYVQDVSTGTVVRVSSDLTCVAGVDATQLASHTLVGPHGVGARLVVAQIASQVLDFGFQDSSYAMTYHQVYHRYVYPKLIEGTQTAPELLVHHAPTSYTGKVDCFLVDSHGRLVENAFKKKMTGFGRISLGHLQFNTAKARRTQDGCHLRFEYISEDICMAYMLFPVKMANSYHKISRDTKTMRVAV